MAFAPPGIPVGAPYCGYCGYALANLNDASRCPECGRPLVEVLVRKTAAFNTVRAVRIRSEVTVFGLPLYHVAFGPRLEHGERFGLARGVVALGDVAVGGVAIGGSAFGVIALGGAAFGLASIGGMSVGLLGALGGCAIGGVAVGGGAVGVCASGGGAAGIVAQGGGAYGIYARGPGASGTHVIAPNRGINDPAAVEMFKSLAPIMGSAPPTGLQGIAQIAIVPLSIGFVLLILMAMLVLAFRRTPGNPYATPEQRRSMIP